MSVCLCVCMYMSKCVCESVCMCFTEAQIQCFTCIMQTLSKDTARLTSAEEVVRALHLQYGFGYCRAGFTGL